MLAYMAGATPCRGPQFTSTTSKRWRANQFYVGRGIPDLVLWSMPGETVLSDSFNGEQYLGPTKVIDDIKRLVTP